VIDGVALAAEWTEGIFWMDIGRDWTREFSRLGPVDGHFMEYRKRKQFSEASWVEITAALFHRAGTVFEMVCA
jgi:hypothetical protein